jgi:Domain of unknown function (DUF4351)
MELSPLYLAAIQAAEDRGKKSVVIRQLKRQLKHQVGDLSPQIHENIKSLPMEKLEDLSEALLDFTKIEDLTNWLDTSC